jgi:hypothetical protein
MIVKGYLCAFPGLSTRRGPAGRQMVRRYGPLRLFLTSLIVSALAGAGVGGGSVQVGRKWTLTPPSDDRGDRIKFGQAACVSHDGTRMVVGANGYDQFKGAVYVYDLAQGAGNRAHHWRRKKLEGSDSRSAESKKVGELRLVDRGSGFGFSCAMDRSGDLLLIGAPGHELQKGTVYVFSYSRQTNTWTEGSRLEGPERRNSDSFGWTVASSGGGATVAVGAKGRRANNGEVYVYKRDRTADFAGEYSLAARITPPDYTDETGPRGIRIRNNFGVSLDMSAAGDLIAVGCTGFKSERGAVYVMALDSSSGSWNLLQRLVAPQPKAFGFFGFKLAMDDAGSTVAVGADGEDNYRGSVYVFSRLNQTAGSGAFGGVVHLQAPAGMTEDNYGGSIALSGDGQVLAVGSPGANKDDDADHGAYYVYTRLPSGGWDLVRREMLEDHDAAGRALYSWAVALTGSGHRILATSPDSQGASGIVTVGSLGGVQSARTSEAGGRVLERIQSAAEEARKRAPGAGPASLSGHEDL